MNPVVTLLMVPALAQAGAVFDGYEAFYATWPDTLFRDPGVELQRYARMGDESIRYGWQGMAVGRRQALELRDGSLTLNGRVLKHSRIRAFPGEVVDQNDLGMGTVAHFAPGWVCLENTPASASGSAVRHRTVYLVRRGVAFDQAWRLPSLFAHCASIRWKDRQILVQKATYRYVDGQDMATGLTLDEFALVQGNFTPTGASRWLDFVEPGNVYKLKTVDGPVR